jgi:hypothetical protein
MKHYHGVRSVAMAIPHYTFRQITYERRSGVVNTPASYSRGPGLKSRPGYQQCCLRFSRSSSVPPGEYRDSTLKLGHYRLLPNPFKFIIINLSPFHSTLYDKWKMSCKGFERKRSWPDLRYYPGIRLEGPGKNHEKLWQDSRSPGRDLNPGPGKQEG